MVTLHLSNNPTVLTNICNQNYYINVTHPNHGTGGGGWGEVEVWE